VVEVDVGIVVSLAAGKPVAMSDSARTALRETCIGLPLSRARVAFGGEELVAHGS